MGTYREFSREEVERALPPGWAEDPGVPGREVVYRWDLPIGEWAIFCYSALQKGEDTSRAVGEDAIRFALVDTLTEKGVGSAIRVHRTGDVPSLARRMKTRFDELEALARDEERFRCRKCGAPTVERRNRSTGELFRGCSRWKDCKDGVPIIKKRAQPALGQVVVDKPPLDARGDGSAPIPEPPDRPNVLAELAGVGVDTATPVVPAETPAPADAEVIVVGDAVTVETRAWPLLAFPWPEFNPVQSAVFPYVSQDVNIVVAAPTSAGKTVCAELAASLALHEGKTCVFLSPLKAVTQERYDDWTATRFQGRSISIVTGDYVLTKDRQEELSKADLILLTSEMLDSRTRRMRQEKNEWLFKVGALVCDEAHLLTMEGRGDRLESGLMRFTLQNPAARLVLLSATMPNVEELGRWVSRLNGKRTVVVRSDWRPVPSETHYLPHSTGGRYWEIEESKIDTATRLVMQYPGDRYLVFTHTKATGRKLLGHLRDRGVDADFHSADLSLDTRRKLEKEFKQR